MFIQVQAEFLSGLYGTAIRGLFAGCEYPAGGHVKFALQCTFCYAIGDYHFGERASAGVTGTNH
jgi:hypothetical protein